MNKLFKELLEKRGLTPDFLDPKYENLTNPNELPDMKKAVDRILQAKEKGEKVLIYGDYDVDGVTATTIMARSLKAAGIKDLSTMLPDRFVDGYGMSSRLIERAKKEKIQLVVTVDCGSNNDVIIDQLNQEKIDVIVTDHHEVSGKLPEAVAVINPKRPDFRLRAENEPKIAGLMDLSGAGVAFMLARALVDAGAIPFGQEKWLMDLAMVGIICDSMKLTGDNRIICYYGFIVLKKTRRPGFKELMRVADIKKLNSTAIGYQIGPRLNAAGRMKTAEKALELLMTDSPMKAAELAEELNKLNLGRRAQQQAAIKEVEEFGVNEDPVLVVNGKWNEGIVGIISGKLTERYKKPSFVLTEVGGEYKGSGRSFGDFNLALALKECEDILTSGGGHAEACGVKFPKDKLDEFTERVNRYYRSLHLPDQRKYFDVTEDLTVAELSDLDTELIDDLAKMEPFGEGNP
ncbi:single-stranded-DNA-specific exonuclease RecJ, partial [Candidatus Saccharibacteria bacterium]|nr:single-stranded-DNA-specific exonuclease RecJ [Candidatus Saccharibacteria bacterium]